MRLSRVVATLVFLSTRVASQPRPAPIIDMHMHATSVVPFTALSDGRVPVPHCVPMTDYPVPASGREWRSSFANPGSACRTTMSATSDTALMRQTLEIMERRNIIGVISGSRVGAWMATRPNRLIPANDLGSRPPVDSLRAWLRSGRYAAIAEVAVQYGGMEPDDPTLRPFWALAEELEIPFGIHIGTGPVGAAYFGPFPQYRARLHSPLLLEEVLVRHPRLRVWIMHAGWPMLDDLLAMLWTHPHLYVDVGVLTWALPRKEFHRYLQRIVEAGFGKRVMFGSDQMIWPETIEMAVESIESAPFLTADQKRDILYNNAARFLRLSPQEIARHHGANE
jgi:predicted TIM-barrel fold metal-dependent hydrolase